METRLWKPDLFEEFCQEFVRERNRLHGEATAAATTAAREQAAIDRRMAELIDWICTGEWRQSPALEQRVRSEMAELEHKKADLTALAEAADYAQRARPLLHPEMGKQYRDWVIQARDRLSDEARRVGAIAALRQMVEGIVLTPEGDRLAIELKGDLGAMLAAASPSADPKDLQRQVSLVAGAGFEPATFGL